MSKEWMLTTLLNLGFKQAEAQVYVCLATEGSKKAAEIAKMTKLDIKRLCRTLSKLHNEGIIDSSKESPAQFSAVAFAEVLDLLGKHKREQQRILEESRERLLSTWRSLIEKVSADS